MEVTENQEFKWVKGQCLPGKEIHGVISMASPPHFDLNQE
jgi:hypothetical protein